MCDEGEVGIASLVRALRPRPRWPRPARWAWARLLRARYQLFQRRRYDRLVLEEVAGLPILVTPGVFNPKLLYSGEFLAECLTAERVPSSASVLDLGCGTGVGGVAAARHARRVVSADVNPAAVRCARANAALNGVEDRVEVLESDLFSALGERRFDRVLFNPPYFRGEPRSALDHAWRSQDVLERFAAELPRHLEEGGLALIVFSTIGDLDGLLRGLLRAGLVVELLEQRDLVSEVLVLYGVSRGARATGPRDE